MDKKKVIAIGADHYNTLWLVRSLGMAGFYPIAVIINNHHRSFVGASRYCKECYIINSNENAIKLLMTLQLENKAPIIASSDSVAEILDVNFDYLSSKYVLHNCEGKGGRISFWMDKARMLEAANKSGLTTPFSISLNLNKAIEMDKIPFPCLIKPEVSAFATKNSFRVCNNQEDLCSSILTIKEECSEVVLQEYVQKDFEYLVYGVRTMEDEIILPGGLRKVHLCNSLNNMGMMSYSYISSEIPKQLGDFDGIKTFLKNIDYHGVFSMEFMITKDKAFFLEINLRNDGTVYCTTQAGVNMPALWVASVYGLDSSDMSRTFKRDRTYGMNETNYVKYTLHSQSIIKTLCELSKVKAFSLIKWNDLKPIAAKILPSLFAYNTSMEGGVNISSLMKIVVNNTAVKVEERRMAA